MRAMRTRFMRSASTATGRVGTAEPGRAGDGDDQQDPGVGEVEGVANVRCQHIEGALRGLVEQLDRHEDAQREEGCATAQLADARRAAHS